MTGTQLQRFSHLCVCGVDCYDPVVRSRLQPMWDMFIGLGLVSSGEALCAAAGSNPNSKDRDCMGIGKKQTCGRVLRQIRWAT